MIPQQLAQWRPQRGSKGVQQNRQTTYLWTLEILYTLQDVKACGDFQIVSWVSDSWLVWMTQDSTEHSLAINVLSNFGTEHRSWEWVCNVAFLFCSDLKGKIYGLVNFLWRMAETLLLSTTWGVFIAANIRGHCLCEIFIPLPLCNFLGEPSFLTLYHRAGHMKLRMHFLPGLWWLCMDGMKEINLKSLILFQIKTAEWPNLR